MGFSHHDLDSCIIGSQMLLWQILCKVLIAYEWRNTCSKSGSKISLKNYEGFFAY